MVINKYIKGIAFVLLMMSVVLIAMAAANDITITVTKPANGSTINGTSFEFIVEVNDSIENITNVEFYYKNTSVVGWTNFYSNNTRLSNGTLHTYRKSFNTTSLENGDYQLNVTVVDNSTTKIDTSIFFTITNVLSDNTPPRSVTNLGATEGQTYINWTWTDPTDSDFSYVKVYLNTTTGSILYTGNVPNGTKYFNSSTTPTPGLTLSSNTTYRLSTQTVDNNGNKNNSIVYNETTTLPNTVSAGPISLGSNVVANFSVIGSPGNTSMTVSSTNTFGVSHTSIFNATGSYYNITTTASFTGGYVIVEVPYTPGSFDENRVKLYHLESGVWKDVTSGRDTNANKVYGNVTSLSPFVPGDPIGPVITKVSPADPISTAGSSTQSFDITVSQDANVTWTIGSFNQTNLSVPAGNHVYFLYTLSSPANYTVSVNATNVNGSDTESWNWTVHPKSYAKGNRIWDGSKPTEFSLTYTWNPMSFSGFFYDMKSDVGNESLTVTLNGYSDRTIDKGDLDYSTTPEEVNFGYSKFGSYQVIGFMAEKYFAGYTGNTTVDKPRPSVTFSGKSALAQGQLLKVLMDDDTQRTVSVGSTLTLKEGYVIKAKDIDTNARIMLISLLKDGNEVDSTPLSAGETYIYSKKVGNVADLPLIMVRFDNVFSGREVQAAFLKGIFQISESATTVRTGDQFSRMKVTTVSTDKIQMENSEALSLSEGSVQDLMGDMKILVADNSSVLRFALSVEKTGGFEVRSTVYRDDDPVDEWTPYNFGINIGKTSLGFYYDLDDGIGNESMRLVTSPVSGRSIPADGLVYSTMPQEVSFGYSRFGSYQVIGFMADKYFAGYTIRTAIDKPRPSITFTDKSALAQGQLHKVLIDDDTQRTVSVGSTLTLKEGYVIKAKDIDTNARIMLISLLKDGSEVDSTPLSAGETYIYSKKVGNVADLPLIMVRFDNVFSGREVQAAFLKGLFQISETPTTVKTGDQFNRMKVRSVSRDRIEMKNDANIDLSPNSADVLMGNIKLKVADDSDKLRFYFAVDVTPEMVANQLLIDAPAKATAGDVLNIKVTAGGNTVDGASVAIGSSSVGDTDKNGLINYTIPKTLKGIYNLTATKLGYQSTTRSIEILQYVEYRLSIEAPAKANQFDTISMRITYNGTAISGASVTYDNASIGSTDSNGTVTYKLETSGTHTISASKIGYITVAREIEVRMPYTEYKALDINVTPGVIFTGQKYIVWSNITNVGTKAETLPVSLIVNNSVVDNRNVSIAPGKAEEINFTQKMTLPAGNYTIEILGQKKTVEVREEPVNYLLVGVIATGLGAIIIYLLTAKGKISLGALKGKLNLEALKSRFGKKGP